jgi:hypothetical protein
MWCRTDVTTVREACCSLVAADRGGAVEEVSGESVTGGRAQPGQIH